MRRFVVYRPSPPEHYAGQGTANPPDQPQYEGVVFSDGTVCVRWLTSFKSHSIWSTWADLWAVHGHEEYGTIVTWLDPPANPAEFVENIQAPCRHDWIGYVDSDGGQRVWCATCGAQRPGTGTA